MTSKVKAQKTRLSNYLVKELGAKFRKSQSTESEYYELSSFSIRISDHTMRRNDHDLNIFIPFNDPNTFIVESNYTISVLKSLKEVKIFLHSLIFIQELWTTTLQSDCYQSSIEVNEKVARLVERINELEKMVETRNEAINILAERARLAEEAVLKDPNAIARHRLLRAGSLITINGINYPMHEFPETFRQKIKNIIISNKIKPL